MAKKNDSFEEIIDIIDEDYLPDTLWEGDAYDDFMYNYLNYKGL